MMTLEALTVDRDAAQLARVLADRGTSALVAVTLSMAARRDVEAAARVEQPSAASWRTAVEMLAGSARPRARQLTS